MGDGGITIYIGRDIEMLFALVRSTAILVLCFAAGYLTTRLLMRMRRRGGR